MTPGWAMADAYPDKQPCLYAEQEGMNGLIIRKKIFEFQVAQCSRARPAGKQDEKRPQYGEAIAI
jgi:hypothetical protein